MITDWYDKKIRDSKIYNNNKKPEGIAKIIPSKRSKRPPWPGNKNPVSFILAFLLKYEINKSPIWEIVDTIKTTKNIISTDIKFLNKITGINNANM